MERKWKTFSSGGIKYCTSCHSKQGENEVSVPGPHKPWLLTESRSCLIHSREDQALSQNVRAPAKQGQAVSCCRRLPLRDSHWNLLCLCRETRSQTHIEKSDVRAPETQPSFQNFKPITPSFSNIALVGKFKLLQFKQVVSSSFRFKASYFHSFREQCDAQRKRVLLENILVSCGVSPRRG